MVGVFPLAEEVDLRQRGGIVSFPLRITCQEMWGKADDGACATKMKKEKASTVVNEKQLFLIAYVFFFHYGYLQI